MKNEIPSDFPHQPPEGYRYEVVRKNASTVAIWTVCNPGFVYNNGNDVRCIWGFYNTKKEMLLCPNQFNQTRRTGRHSYDNSLYCNATQS